MLSAVPTHMATVGVKGLTEAFVYLMTGVINLNTALADHQRPEVLLRYTGRCFTSEVRWRTWQIRRDAM